MTDALSWLISVVVVAILACFLVYIVGLRALPTDKRPTTPVYDRLGREIGLTQNPDFHVNPGEDPRAEPPSTPRPDDAWTGGGERDSGS